MSLSTIMGGIYGNKWDYVKICEISHYYLRIIRKIGNFDL